MSGLRRTLRRLSPCCVLLVAVFAGKAHAVDTTWVNPEALPALLQQPLSLFATTGPRHQGEDYLLVPPGAKATVATIAGPAIILRLWSTSGDNASLALDMTLDGRQEPLYAKGQLPPGVKDDDPLRSLDGLAYWSYIPLPVRKQATFTARNLDPKNPLKVYLQVGYRKATTKDLAQVTRTNVAATRQALGFILKDPTITGRGEQLSGTASPGKPWDATFTQPTLIRLMALDITPGTFEQLAATRLRLTCDGQVTVDVPLGALFCQYWELADYTSAATAVQGQMLFLRFPLPVARSLSVAIDAWNGKPLDTVAVLLHTEALPKPPEYRFCAQYYSGVSAKGEPLHLGQLTGPGIWLGANLAVDGLAHKTFAFLEGNEQVFVDGAATPTYEGTGTEDFGNGAWYFESGVLSRAFHGVTFKQDKDPPRVSAYRYLVPDCVTFKSSLKLDLQHGSRNTSSDTLYRAVVFWYQKPPVTIAEPKEARVTTVAPQASAAGAPATRTAPSAGLVGGLAAAALIAALVIVALVYRRRAR